MRTTRLEAFNDGVLAIIITISLVPFVTARMGENHFAAVPTAYGLVLGDAKRKLSPLFYMIAIPAAFVLQWIAGALYVAGCAHVAVPRSAH